MRRRGHIVTFYSYKGGTGRTMALANVAALLARRPATRILVMDWDLEAPGLHRFFKECADEADGVIDLLETLARAIGRLAQPLDEEATTAVVRALPLERFVAPTSSGRIDVMTAGDPHSSTYPRRVSDFPWERLHAAAPQLFTKLAEMLADRYDYVLIDSRTGITDTSGICTAVLPDKLVVVFTPNHQSVEGAVGRARAAVTYRRNGDDLRPLVVYPVASRVELSEEILRQQWRHGDSARELSGYEPMFEAVLGEIYALPGCDLKPWFDEVQIQHAARYAYGEEIVVDTESLSDRLSLARSYASLERALIETDGPWELRSAETRTSTLDTRREQIALDLLAAEVLWHTWRADRGRRLLLLTRGLQLVAGLFFVIVGVLTLQFSGGGDHWFENLPLLAGVGGVALAVELLATLTGAGEWQRHAALAESLRREQFRYETRSSEYGDTDDPLTLLAQRVSERLDAVYDDWPRARFLGELAPRPQRRTYSLPSRNDEGAAQPLPPR